MCIENLKLFKGEKYSPKYGIFDQQYFEHETEFDDFWCLQKGSVISLAESSSQELQLFYLKTSYHLNRVIGQKFTRNAKNLNVWRLSEVELLQFLASTQLSCPHNNRSSWQVELYANSAAKGQGSRKTLGKLLLCIISRACGYELVCERNPVSVSGTETKVQFCYQYRSRNVFF